MFIKTKMWKPKCPSVDDCIGKCGTFYGPVVKFQATITGAGFHPNWGKKTLHATWSGQKILLMWYTQKMEHYSDIKKDTFFMDEP